MNRWCAELKRELKELYATELTPLEQVYFIGTLVFCGLYMMSVLIFILVRALCHD